MSNSGRPQSRRNALRAVNVASKAVGLWSEEDGREPVGLHDLRHSAASFYFKQGLRTREVSRLLRHANAIVTQVAYGGIAPKEEEEILEVARLAFGGA
jgi:integrase